MTNQKSKILDKLRFLIIKKPFHIIIIAIFILSSVCSFCYANAADNDTNAATIYIKAQSLLTVLPNDFIKKTNEIINNGWKYDNGELRGILSKNQEALSEFKKAVKLNYCEFNSKSSIKEVLNEPRVPYLKDIMSLARLALIEGRLCEQENKFDLALENYFLVLQFANQLGWQKKDILLVKILEQISRRYSCKIIGQYINRKTITGSEYRYILDRLTSLSKNKVGLEAAFLEQKEINKYFTRLVVEEAWRKGKYFVAFYNPFFYKESDTLFDEFFPKLIMAFKENNVEEMRKTFEREHSLDRVYFLEPAKTEVSLGITGYTRDVTRYYTSQVEFDLLIIATAIKLYESEKNSPLDILEMLVPQYLSDLPKDPFNNFKPLRYEKKDTGWIVYSFGPDRQDNHGDFRFDENDLKNKTGDIVFSSF